MKFLKENINLIYDIIFSVLVFTLPLSMAIPNICLAIIFFLFIIFKRRDANTPSKYFKIVLILASFYLIKSLITGTFSVNFFFNKQLLTVLALIIFTQKVNNRKLVKLSFLFGVLLAVLITLFNIGLYYFKYSAIPLGDTIQSQELLLNERPYFGFMSIISIIISLQLKNEINRYKLLFFLNISLLLFFIILISARLSLSLVFIIFIISILTDKGINKKKFTILLSLLVIGFFMIFITNKNLKKRFHIKPTFKETLITFSNYEPRIIIWDCAVDLISRKDYSFIFGYKNISNTRNKLVNCYGKKIKNKSKRAYYFKERFNVHNQFLDFLLSGGIIGLIIFIACFFIVIHYNEYNIFTILIVLSFVLFCFVENILWRQLGAYLFGVFIPIFNAIPSKSKK